MAVKYDGGIMLGADGRSATVSYNNTQIVWLNQFCLDHDCWKQSFRQVRTHPQQNLLSKVLQLSALTTFRSGTSSHTREIARYVRNYIDI